MIRRSRSTRVLPSLALACMALGCTVIRTGESLPDRAASLAAFDRLKSLEGTWRGQSTKGWTDRIVYRVLAGGSALIEDSFDAHPGEAMATVFAPDGDRLLLTHYCAAKNQPRLVLSAIEDGGATLDFHFLDATNLKSRDVGHMDRVRITFVDADHFIARWTWFQDGKENWLEEIRHERVKG